MIPGVKKVYFGSMKLGMISVGDMIVYATLVRVDVPTLSGSYTYNGSEQTVSISTYDTRAITVSGNKATNAGTYTVTFHLTNPHKYRWRDGTAADKTATWSIARASVGDKPGSSASTTYNGSSQGNGYTTPDGVTMTGSNSGTNAGSYTAYYTPDSNHCWSDGTTSQVSRTLTIARASVGAKPGSSVSKTYNGSSQNNGYTTPTGVSMSGSNSGTSVGSYTAYYTPDSNHIWSDGTTGQVSRTLTIARASVGAKPSTAPTKDYNGSWQSNGYTTPSGVSASGSTGGTSGGTYTATYTPDSNHCWSDSSTGSVSVTLTIYYRWIRYAAGYAYSEASQSYQNVIGSASPVMGTIPLNPAGTERYYYIQDGTGKTFSSSNGTYAITGGTVRDFGEYISSQANLASGTNKYTGKPRKGNTSASGFSEAYGSGSASGLRVYVLSSDLRTGNIASSIQLTQGTFYSYRYYATGYYYNTGSGGTYVRSTSTGTYPNNTTWDGTYWYVRDNF